MAKIIPFPDPYEQQLKVAKRAIESGNHLEAKKILNQLYEESPTFEVNQLLVRLSVLEGQEAEALIRAGEMETDYLSSTEGIKQYFQLIVLNNQFIRAHQLLNSGKQFALFNEEQTMLELFENVFEQTNFAVFEEKKRQFSSFQSLTMPIPQLQWHNWLIGLTKHQFKSLVFPSLKQMNSPFMNSRCCEILIKLGEQSVIGVMNSRSEKVENVDFSTVSLLEDSAVYHTFIKELNERYSDHPFLHEVLLTEILGHWAYLFPFLPNETEIAQWIAIYAQDYEDEFMDDHSLDSTEQEIVKVKQDIRNKLHHFE